jgi:predicted enzyme related to lactoylglutathione lyase
MNTFDNVIYTVADLDAAKAIHTALLDTEPHTDTPYYVGFNVDGVEIGLAPRKADGQPTPVAHIRVPDIDAALTRVQQAGATLVDGPRDVGGGNLIATVTDHDGVLLGVIQRA